MAAHPIKSWHQSGGAVHIVKTRWGLRVMVETAQGTQMSARRLPDGSIAVDFPLYLSDTLHRVLIPRAFRWLERQAS